MTLSGNQYHFVTNWRVEAKAEEVYHILDDVEGLTRWWPSVYLGVKILREGDERGIGKVVELYTKGFLPYTLRWNFRVTEKTFPTQLALEAFGDFNGTGVWTIGQDADPGFCKVRYDWRISADKPILKYLSFLLKPVFSANHHWAMRKGEESLKLELLRCRATSEEERRRIPKAPPPTFPHNFFK